MRERRWYDARGDQTNKRKRPHSGSVERIMADPAYAGLDTLNEDKLAAKKAYERRKRGKHGRSRF